MTDTPDEASSREIPPDSIEHHEAMLQADAVSVSAHAGDLGGDRSEGAKPTSTQHARGDSFGSISDSLTTEALREVNAGDPDQLETISGEAGLWSDAWHTLRRSPVFVAGSVVVIIMALMSAFPWLFTFFYPNHNDTKCELARSANVPGQGRPSWSAWFGYDVQGCDYYLRTIEGARTSIMVGIFVTLLSVLIAITFGTIAGYVGGWIDALISRITDVWVAIPTLLFGIMFLSVVKDLPAWVPIVDEQRGVAEVTLVLALTGWPTQLRLMRSSVLTNKEADYVSASRSIGATNWRIVTRHIIPNSLAPLIVYSTISMGVVISAEAALSFLGVGVQLPAVSWGLMINTASARITSAPHLLIFPGIFLTITVLSFIMMGDALRDALDPKLR